MARTQHKLFVLYGDCLIGAVVAIFDDDDAVVFFCGGYGICDAVKRCSQGSIAIGCDVVNIDE